MSFWSTLWLFARNVLPGFVNPLASAWMTAISVLVVASLCRRDPRKRRTDFIIAIGYCAFAAVGIQLSDLARTLTPVTRDAQFFALERKFHFPLSDTDFLWTRHRCFIWTFTVAYFVLPVVQVSAWLEKQSVVLRDASIFGGLLCWPFYLLVPACGPFYYTHNMLSIAWRNCFPSMHLVTALQIAFNAENRWWKATLWCYAGVIAASTVIMGEHYFIDLVVAIPYALAMQWVATKVHSPSSLAAVAVRYQ